MKLHPENLATLFIIAVILLGGCAGCGQKTAPEAPVTPPNQSTPDRTPKLSGAKRNGTKLKPPGKTAKLSSKNFRSSKYLANLKDVEYIELTQENKGGIPLPWDPIIVPVESWKIQLKKGSELRKQRRSKKLSTEEYNEQVIQLHREIGFVTSLQIVIELDGGSIDNRLSKLVNLAYAENPDDFDTLLLWVFAGGNLAELYGEEKTAATRRLSEMKPNHPWVLHNLAKSILGTNPQEALGYAQKAQELDPRYLPLGVEGLCYFQMGDYQKALASFRRSYQYAVENSHPDHILRAIGVWSGVAENVVNSGGESEDGREKKRRAGIPILGLDLPTRVFR